MTKIAYLECSTGIAGDMCLAALIHAGLPVEYLKAQLSLLGISNEYELRVQKVHRMGQVATKIDVDLLDAHGHEEQPTFRHDHHHAHSHDHDHDDQHSDGSITQKRDHQTHLPHRHLPEIETIIKQAGLPSRVERWSLEIFNLLALSEATVHGVTPSEVHFHEVGATDAIVDIVGTCIGLDWLGIEELYCSALPTGGGTVKAAHGLMAVPTPAVLELWKRRGVPVYDNGIKRELCTPTGSSIVCALAQRFGPPPPMIIEQIGLGSGSINLPLPNILRLWIGTKSPATFDAFYPNQTVTESQEKITVLETQIDDLNPQVIGYIFENLFNAGALDVFTQPIMMKKSRLGVLLTVICHPPQAVDCEQIIFRETTTLGIRISSQYRSILPREIQEVETKYGVVRVKIARMGKEITNVQPEYEDCATLARKSQVSWREIHRLTLDSWYHQTSVN